MESARQRRKLVYYAITYWMTPKRLGELVGISLENAAKLIAEYKEKSWNPLNRD